MVGLGGVLVVLIFEALILKSQAYVRLCYFRKWSSTSSELGRLSVNHINVDLCTHLVYVSGDFDWKGELRPEGGDDEFSVYREFNNLRIKNPKLRTLLLIGGWNFGTERFSKMAGDIRYRGNFVRSSVKFLRKHGFDGIDLDWEYPTRRGGLPEDRQNFVLLCKELRHAFNTESRPNGTDRLLLTTAVAARSIDAEPAYDVPHLIEVIDLFLILSWDFIDENPKRTAHHSPLYTRPAYKGSRRQFLNLYDSCRLWVDRGLPRNKMVVGLSLYGRSFTLTDPTNSSIAVPAIRGPPGPINGRLGLYTYYEICSLLASDCEAHQEYDDEQKVPYVVSGSTWISYDDISSLQTKGSFVSMIFCLIHQAADTSFSALVAYLFVRSATWGYFGTLS